MHGGFAREHRMLQRVESYLPSKARYDQKIFQQASLCDWSALQQDRAMIATLSVSTPDVTHWNMLEFEDHPMRHLQRSNFSLRKILSKTPRRSRARCTAR